MADRLEGSDGLLEMEADFPETRVSDKRIQNDWAPGNLQAHRKVAELIMDTVGAGQRTAECWSMEVGVKVAELS